MKSLKLNRGLGPFLPQVYKKKIVEAVETSLAAWKKQRAALVPGSLTSADLPRRSSDQPEPPGKDILHPVELPEACVV